jgi:hypothetical protein
MTGARLAVNARSSGSAILAVAAQSTATIQNTTIRNTTYPDDHDDDPDGDDDPDDPGSGSDVGSAAADIEFKTGETLILRIFRATATLLLQ